MLIDLDGLNLEAPELEADSGGFKNVDPGRWRLRVVKAESKNSKTKNNPIIELQVEVTARADGADAGKNRGRRTRMWLCPKVDENLSQKGKDFQRGRLKNQLQALRFPLSGVLNPEEFINREFIGTVTHTRGASTVDDDGREVPSDKVFANISDEAAITE